MAMSGAKNISAGGASSNVPKSSVKLATNNVSSSSSSSESTSTSTSTSSAEKPRSQEILELMYSQDPEKMVTGYDSPQEIADWYRRKNQESQASWMGYQGKLQTAAMIGQAASMAGQALGALGQLAGKMRGGAGGGGGQGSSGGAGGAARGGGVCANGQCGMKTASTDAWKNQDAKVAGLDSSRTTDSSVAEAKSSKPIDSSLDQGKAANSINPETLAVKETNTNPNLDKPLVPQDKAIENMSLAQKDFTPEIPPETKVELPPEPPPPPPIMPVDTGVA